MRDLKVAEQQRRTKRRRSYRRGGAAVLVVAVVIGLVVLLSSGSTPKKKAAAPPNSTTTTTSTLPKGTPTTAPVSHTAVAPVCPPTAPAGAAKRVIVFTKAPPTCISPTAVFDATVRTDVGTFVVRLDARTGIAGVNDFVFLARYHFYDLTVFHRVIQGFVVQGGDPTGTGAGGPGYSFTGNTPPASCTKSASCYPTGTVALANSGAPSSDGSQFFVVLPGGGAQLQPNYTVIGHVVSGMPVVERIAADGAPPGSSAGTPKVLHHIVSVTITPLAA